MVIEKIENPSWDGDIKEILSPHKDAFEFRDVPDKTPLNHYDWWRIKDAYGFTIGVAYMNESVNEYGLSEAEISICTRYSEIGAGGRLLSFLESEAKRNGHDVTAAVVKEKNPEHQSVVSWFANKGYKKVPSNKDTVMLKDINRVGVLDGLVY